jgi:uncharacterized protein YbjT (DUF2867 family)
MPKKVIAVTGATGAQGSGLVRSILANPDSDYTVRAITRDPNSDAAKAFAEAGAEIVKGDLDDPKSITDAFAGAHGAYCVTFYWAHFSPEKELQHARTLVQSAKDAGVHHVVWSTLEDTRTFVPLESRQLPTLMGKYKVPHFDAKGEADGLFRDAGVPTTFLLTSFYWDNFIYFGSGPTRGNDGTLVLTMPLGDRKMPGIAAEDIGKCAFGIFKRGDAFIGKTVGIAGEHLSGAEMAEKMSRALGEPVRYNDIDPDVYRSLGFPGAEDLGNMFQFKRDFSDRFRAPRDVEFARSLNPELMNFDMWLNKYAAKIPIGAPA